MSLYGRAALFGVLLGFALHVFSGSGGDTALGRLGGDFPAFYAAGSLVGDGAWDSLYDIEAQAEAQASLHGSDAGDSTELLYFAYPPPVASLYRPLAALDYRMAYALHSLLMGVLLVVALALARPMVPLLNRRFEAAVTASLLFYPALRAITGGQNTTLTLLLLILFWRSVDEENDVLTGLAIAGLLYKPQFAVPLFGLMVWQRRPKAVAVASAGAGVLWAYSAAVMGAGWLASWWHQVGEFAALDAEINAHNAVSFLGVSEALLGAGSLAARLVAAPLMAAGVAALLWLWRPASSTDPALRFAATVVGLVAISPHAMFYDAGLLVVAGIVMAGRLGPTARPVLVACWGLAWLQLAGESIGVAPAFGLVLVACWTLGRLVLGEHRTQQSLPQPVVAQNVA
jgi:hypothetical protein